MNAHKLGGARPIEKRIAALDASAPRADHDLEVLHRRAKPGGGPRTLVALVGTLAALGYAGGPAAAQLPELLRADPPPPPEEPVGQVVEPVQQIVHESPPSPLEEIVQDSPLAPVRESAREVVGSPGGGLPDGNPGGVLPGGRLPGDT
ncbi:MAG: hypothetical protein ACRDM0_25180, partial [Thermoleophilaceae bacterium]